MQFHEGKLVFSLFMINFHSWKAQDNELAMYDIFKYMLYSRTSRFV